MMNKRNLLINSLLLNLAFSAGIPTTALATEQVKDLGSESEKDRIMASVQSFSPSRLASQFTFRNCSHIDRVTKEDIDEVINRGY